jgi:hypothetical protein
MIAGLSVPVAAPGPRDVLVQADFVAGLAAA